MSQTTQSIEKLKQELEQARRRIEELEGLPRETEERLRRQSGVLAELASGDEIRQGDSLSCFRRSTEAAAETLAVERASVWLFNAERSRLVLEDLYEASEGRHSSGLELDAVRYPRYFEALQAGRAIAADDAHNDAATSEFSAEYLTPLGITSMLDAPIRVGGELRGVVCHEHVGSQRHWAAHETQFAASIADFASLALELGEQRRAERLASGTNGVLRLLARGRPLDEVLERLALTVDEESNGMRCAVLVIDEDGQRLRQRGAPSLPPGFAEGIDGMAVAPGISPCGYAALEGKRIIVEDLSKDCRWSGREFAMSHGLRACWSEPIFDHERQVLGVLAMFYQQPRAPDPSDLVLTESAAHLAGIAIERHKADESKRQLTLAVEHAMSGIARTDTRGRFVTVNEGYARTLGYARQELLSKHWSEVVHAADVGAVEQALETLRQTDRAELEARAVKRDGTVFHCRVLVVRAQERATSGYVCFMQDITDRKKAEEERSQLQEQLRQSQKMEAIGQLAGGVAHDFNNLLTSILGNAEMVLETLNEEPVAQFDPFVETAVEEIQQAGKRAAALTRQLLAFGRKQIRQVQLLEPNDLVIDLESMLARLIGENIRLETRLADSLPPVRADAAQIEQAILNLAVNARDAMPSGGELTIETSLVQPRDLPDQKPPLDRPHVQISVNDTGAGMRRETVEHIFEPFFTTKPVGKGTGLGLATVYGIVAQSEGYVLVDSEPGRGSRFRVLLPAAERSQDEPVPEPDLAPAPTEACHETILLCEDEEMVRKPSRRALESVGYTVLEAASPRLAIELFEKHPGEVDMLLTDTIMPEMDGNALAKKLTSRRAGLRVLFVSGYTQDVIGKDGQLDADVEFLAKPFSATTLLTRVREVLDK